jgi:hypothetical protein
VPVSILYSHPLTSFLLLRSSSYRCATSLHSYAALAIERAPYTALIAISLFPPPSPPLSLTELGQSVTLRF